MDGGEDPFQHHPELRGKIADPFQSFFRDFDLQEMDRRMAELGMPPDWRRSDEEREATRHAALEGRRDRDLWVFGYGSLMWDPAFRFAELRHARLEGYHRRFCLRTELGRGSPKNPGLMAGLDIGGSCEGLAFRIRREILEEETEIIWRREMIRMAYAPTFVPLATPQGPVEALAFVIDHRSDHYVAELDQEEEIRLMATGTGVIGTSLAYLEKLLEQLDVLDVEDPALTRLRDAARQHQRAAGNGG